MKQPFQEIVEQCIAKFLLVFYEQFIMFEIHWTPTLKKFFNYFLHNLSKSFVFV